jgi:hypothetical protein
MKTYCQSGGIAPRIQTSALDGDEWSVSRPGRFTPREISPGTHCIGGWVGLGAVLDAVVKRKIPSPRRESNPRNLIVQSVAQRYTDWAIMVLFSHVCFIFMFIFWEQDNLRYTEQHIYGSRTQASGTPCSEVWGRNELSWRNSLQTQKDIGFIGPAALKCLGACDSLSDQIGGLLA